jgi:O-antigen/teichoic acid export membrane protein
MHEKADEIESLDLAAPSSPLKTLLSGSFIYGFGTILVQTVNILLMPILTAHLSPSEYGAVAVLNFAILVASAIFSWGMNSSVGMCYFEHNSARWRTEVIGTAFGLISISAVLLVTCVYACLGWASEYLLGALGYDTATLYAAICAGLIMVAIPFDGKLRLDAKPLQFTAASFVATFAIAGLTLWFVIGLKRGVQGYFEALVIGRLISLVAFYFISGGLTEIIFASAVARRLLRLGIPLMPQFIILYFMQYGNIDLLKRFSGLADAGLYSAGLAIGLASNVVVSSIGNAWAPFFLSYTTRQNEAKEMFGRATKYYILGVGLFSLSFYYFAKLLIIILSAPEYYPGYQVIGPIATSMFMLGLYNMLLPPVYFAKEVGRITYNGLAAILVQLWIAWLLIPQLGILGAAWASVCAYSVFALLLYLVNISKPKYFRIVYHWPALAPFASLYLFSCLGLSFLPSMGVLAESVMFAVHFSVMLIVAYKALDVSEVTSVKRMLSSLAFKGPPRE